MRLLLLVIEVFSALVVDLIAISEPQCTTYGRGVDNIIISTMG